MRLYKYVTESSELIPYESDRDIEEMLKKGRYIPHIEHFVSMDCTWENFTYYRKKLNEIVEGF